MQHGAGTNKFVCDCYKLFLWDPLLKTIHSSRKFALIQVKVFMFPVTNLFQVLNTSIFVHKCGPNVKNIFELHYTIIQDAIIFLSFNPTLSFTFSFGSVCPIFSMKAKVSLEFGWINQSSWISNYCTRNVFYIYCFHRTDFKFPPTPIKIRIMSYFPITLSVHDNWKIKFQFIFIICNRHYSPDFRSVSRRTNLRQLQHGHAIFSEQTMCPRSV